MKSVVEITKKACKNLEYIASNSEVNNIIFRVKGGGCNGFNYILEPMNEKPEKLDVIVKRTNYNLVVCRHSLFHLLGTKIDWQNDYMGSRFVFENPQASAKCGCGTSFSK